MQTYGYYLSYFWANDKRTREALGIKKGTVNEWVRCHDKDLPYTSDLGSVIKYHRNLTSRGYRALVYSGDHDLLVPHLGTQAWVRSLNFSIVDDWRAWHLGGQSAGWVSFSALFYLSLLENRLWAPAEKDQRHRFLNRCPATATIGLYLRHRVFQPVP